MTPERIKELEGVMSVHGDELTDLLNTAKKCDRYERTLTNILSDIERYHTRYPQGIKDFMLNQAIEMMKDSLKEGDK